MLALLAGGLAAALAGLARRRAVAAPERRLPRDRHARLRRNHPRDHPKCRRRSARQRGSAASRSYTNFFWTFAFAAVTVYVVVSLVNSTYGRGFLAVRDDEIAAEAMGINTTRYKVLAFVIGAFFAGIAGGLYAHFKQFIHPEGFDFMKSVDIVVMVILGGMGSTVGVVVAAILLTMLPEVLRCVARIDGCPTGCADRGKPHDPLFAAAHRADADAAAGLVRRWRTR